MATIRQMYERVNHVNYVIPEQIESIVEQLSDKILELNKEDQLFKGKDNQNKDIGKYSKATEEISQGRTGKGFPKREGELFNLYDTGSLFNSIDTVFKNHKLEFFTTQPNHPFFQKSQDQALKLLGLTPDNQYKLNYEMIKPLLIKWIKKSIYR